MVMQDMQIFTRAKKDQGLFCRKVDRAGQGRTHMVEHVHPLSHCPHSTKSNNNNHTKCAGEEQGCRISEAT